MLLSNSVPHHLQATMQSATAALDSLATFISPLFYLIYSYSVKQNNGASFVFKLFSALCLVSFSLCLYVYKSPQIYITLPEMTMSSEDTNNPMTSFLDSKLLADDTNPPGSAYKSLSANDAEEE